MVLVAEKTKGANVIRKHYRFVVLRLTKRLCILLRVAKCGFTSYNLIDKSVEFYGNGD